MRRMGPLSGIVLAVLAAGLPASASADRTDVVDGPTADLPANGTLGNVDLAPDGTGGLTYVKKDAGVDHVYVARYAGGTWQAPERVDPGLAQPSSVPHIAAGNGGRLAVAFLNGNLARTVRAAVAPASGQPFALDPNSI